MTSVLPEIEAQLSERFGAPLGPPEPLGGGLTNHNFRFRFAGVDAVVRIAGDNTVMLGIDRSDEAEATRNAASLGIGPALLAELPGREALVVGYVAATSLEAGALRSSRIPGVVAALRLLHGGPAIAARFDIWDVLVSYARTAREAGVPEHEGEARAREVAAQARLVLTGPEHEPVSCHNDLLAGNLLDDGDRLWIVDWEYAGRNDRYFDLANLAVNNGFTEDDERALLRAYFGEDDERRLARLQLMELVSDAREASWGLVQQGISSLDFDFAGYADEHFARLTGRASAGRLEQLLTAAR
ncbi:MAG: phosphotransferase [Baekduia sp.]|mgnify:CR=1 FL=1